MKNTGLLFVLLLAFASSLMAYNVSGIAVDAESGESLAGLELTLLTEGGWVKTAMTEADGTFAFTNVQEGTNDLEFHYYSPVIINGDYYLRDLYGEPIIVNGEDITDILFEIQPHHPQYQIKGMLYDAVTNQPITNQSISLRLDLFSHTGFFFAWSEDDGNYIFEDLVPDWTYYFDVFDNDYYYGDQIELTIDPNGPEELLIDFYLQPKDGVSVSGQLFDIETNEPILMANRTVRITAINSIWAETNENGEFTFVNVQPGYYANIKVTSEDTAYINCSESTISDFIVPEEGMNGVQLFQEKFETVHVVNADDDSFVPGEIKTITFSLVLSDLKYDEIWGVELHLSSNLNVLNTTPFRRYGTNALVFDVEEGCSYPNRLVWEGYHSVYGQGNVGNLQALNDSVYADVEFQFDENAPEGSAEIFYEVFYSYACVWQPFSFGTIVLENADLAVGIYSGEETSSWITSYPNPTADKAMIRLALDEDINGKIVVFDATGQVIVVPKEGLFKKGINEIALDTSELTKGIYFYTFTTENNLLFGKLVVSW